MGCDIYRLNYNPTNMSMLNYLDKMVAEIQAYGMEVMLVMDDTSGTPQDVANRAKIVARPLQKGQPVRLYQVHTGIRRGGHCGARAERHHL